MQLMHSSNKQNIRIGIFFVVVSVVMIGMGQRHPVPGVARLAKVDKLVATITTPVYRFVDKPFHWWHSWMHTSKQYQAVMAHNAKLRATVMLLQAKLQRLQNLEAENKRLMALLRSSTAVDGKVVAASVLSVSLNPSKQQVLIDKGQDDHVVLGQAVLDAYGIFGRVIEVRKSQSIVAQIDDFRQAVPVEVGEQSIRGMVVGDGPHQPLRLLHMTSTDKVKVGDKIISSGLAGQYPAGYPVGVVATLKQSLDGQFMDITVRPSAKLQTSRQVLLVWHHPSSKRGVHE